MLREMSSLRIFRRNSQKIVTQEDTENASENPTDSSLPSTTMAGSMRAPLCPISEPSQKLAGIPAENSSGSRRSDLTPAKPKGKGFAKADNSEMPAGTTPERHGAVPGSAGNILNRNRFGWSQKNDISSRETNATRGNRSPINHSESIGDTSFTPRSLNYTVSSETHHANGNAQQSNRGFGVGNGGSNYGTPRPVRTGGKASSNQSESSSNSSTPTKSVPRTMNNIVSAVTAMNSFRIPGSQGSIVRTGHNSKNLAMASTPPTVVNTVEVPHFELNEDPAFWMDHNVQVLVRIRPLNGAEVASQGYNRCLKQESAQTVTWLGPPETRFTFDHVACETITQEMLFKVAGLPMVENCMSGYNSCMFAYGQTGSGKTHTMLGDIDELDRRPSANRGMTPRIFEYLFARIKADEESHRHEQLKYVCKCSFLEIYNEQITDLLEPSSTNLQLREDVGKGVYVENLTEIEVRNVHDVVQLLLLGAANRRVAATNMNRESSRSHSVFTCVIESQWEKDSMTNIRYGRLNLVDLAGSERQKSSGAEGDRLKEAANINKSLSTLGLVIMILVDVAHGKQRHIPYRDSRLTFLLQDSLGGNSKTTIIANISSSICSANETLSTLKFAQRAKFIQNNAIINEDASGDVMALNRQIQQLKEELNFFKRQNVSRSLSFRSTIFTETKSGTNNEGSITVVPGNNLEPPECSDLLHSSRALGSPRISSKKLKSLEATLAGALRREQVAENTMKRLEAEIEQLNRLVRQREEDTQCSKMMLRFREDKIRRLESIEDGLLSVDAYLLEEKNALSEELQLIRGRLDRNPELTRFAMENIRLLEQLRRFQDFYEGGEREILLAEVSDLRDQLVEVLEGRIEHDKNPCALSIPQEVLPPELASAARENQMLRLEVDNAHKEIEDCRNHLSACLEANEKMTSEIDELHMQLEELKKTCIKQEEELETLRSQSTGGKSLERENSQDQMINDLKAQLHAEMELRTQIEDVQASLKNNRHDLQEKAHREQELEMRHSEEIMQLQLELESMETVLEEERLCRKEAEDRVLQCIQELEAVSEKSLQVSQELETALAKVEDDKSVIEALESQQLFSINELEKLQVKNEEILEILNRNEEERHILERQNEILREELNRDQKLCALETYRKDQCGERLNCEDTSMQVKLERMQRALDKARKLNRRFQNEQASQSSHEKEMDQVQRQVETETAEVIISLQEELVALRQQVDSTTMRESDTNEQIMHLKGEIEELQVRLTCVTKENEALVSMLAEKDAEIRTLMDEWEKAASELANFLAEGDQALEDASEQMDNIIDSFPQRKLKLNQGVERVVAILAEKEKTIDVLQKRLQHVHNMACDTEGKIKSLKEATLAITEAQQQENDEMTKEANTMRSELTEKLSIIQELESVVDHYKSSIKEADKRATAAFITVKKLAEVNEVQIEAEKRAVVQLEEASEVGSQKDNLIQDLNNENFEARLQIDSLKQEIMKFKEERDELMLALALEQSNVKAAEMKAEVKGKALQNVEDQVEKSWQKVFELEATLSLSFSGIERDLSAERLNVSTLYNSFKRQVQEQFEDVRVLKEDLLYKISDQTEEIERAGANLKDNREKENALVIAFVDAILMAKKMQQRNDRIMCQLRESETSLKCAWDKLQKADLEMKEKDRKVHEMTVSLQAIEVTKARVESEKQQLMVVADQALSTCSEKEQELYIAQKELTCIHVKLEEVENKDRSLNAIMDESLKQLKDLEEEHSRLLADLDAQKSNWDDERQRHHSEKKELEEQMMTRQMMVTEDLAVTQSKLQTTEKKLAESILTVEVLMLEKSNWEIEKEALLKDSADARSKISDKEKELSSLHGTLAEVQLKLQSTEDKVDALSVLLNDFECSEEHWRSEREDLSSKVDLLHTALVEKEKEVEILQNQQVTQVSEAVPRSTLKEDIENGAIKSELERMKTESQNLRENLFEKDETILSVRKEMEAALASLKEAELEMKRTIDEKVELRKAEEQGRHKIESLISEIKYLQDQVNHRERELELLQLEMPKMLGAVEKRMKDAEEGWRKEKEILSLELSDAKLIAAEKTSEASIVFRKFEESQETIKEADLMLNTLLKANENARYDTEQWKNAGQELATERGSLIDEIQRTKNAFEEKEEQFVSMQELMQMNLQETRDLISSVKEVAINSMRGLEEEFEAINTEIGSLKLDLSHALNEPNSWLEEILSIVAEKDSAAFVLHSCQVEALLGKLQTLYTEIDSLNVKLHESNRSISQLEENNMILRGEVDRSCSLGTKLEVEIKTSLGKINEKERQLERLLGQLDQLEKNMSDLEGQEDLMMKWLAAKDFELANLISGVEEKHNNDLEVASKLEIIQSEKGELHLQLNKSCEKIEQMQREKEELCFQLEQSCNKITLMEDQQESICKEIDLLHLQHHESNTRAGELEKYNMDLKNEIKEYKVAIAELQLDLNDGDSERAFEAVKGRDSLGGQLETLKMEMSDLKMKKETLNKAMIEKVSEVAILHQELDQHARVQSSLQETLRQVDGLQRENHELSLQLKQSSERIIHLEEEKMALGQEESKLQERLSSLLLELDQSCERSAYFEKLSADANEKLINGHEEIGALHRQLEEASSSAMCLEEKSKELQDKLSTLEGSFGALQSDLDMKDRDLIQVQLAHSKILEEIEHNHQKSEDLMTRLSASEMENMKLRENIGKEVETEERLFSELQQSNDVIEEIRRENAKHAVDLQEREAEIIKLFQQKEDISNHLYGVQRENEAMKETLSSQNDKLQDLADQIALKDDYLKKVQTIALQLTEDSCYSTHVAEKLEAKLSSLQDRVFSVMPVERADEMLVIEKFLKYISELEDNAHMFLTKTELLELNFKDLFSQNAALMSELQWKEEILKGLQFDLSLLQESASKAKDQKDEVQEASAALKLVQEDLLVKANELNTVMSHNIRLEIELMEKVSEVTSLNVELTKLKETLASVSNENSQLAADVEDLLAKRNSAEEELEEKQRVIEGLEEELLEMSSLVDHQMINSIESMKCELNNVVRERDRLNAEVLALNEQLEMAQAFADEREAIAVEARQVAEARKTYAEEKEEETKLLERSVEELERTVNALESQVDIVKREAERQRLMREDLELELQALRHQMSTMQTTQTSMNIQSSSESMESANENPRAIAGRKLDLREARKQIKVLEKEIEEQDVEIKKCKSHITELVINAETQANEYQQKYKALEAMANQVKAEQTNSNAMASHTNKTGEKTATKSRGSGSPFKCIGLGLAQQMNSERDEELHASKRRIEELEGLLAARQKEIFMLNSRLAAAESMTHDVIRDLLGVKLDMTNYASVLDNQQVQKIAEKARRQNEESQEKEQEVQKLRHQLNDLIEERESWLDEINRRQAEMVAARIAAEKLRQRDQFLSTESDMLKTDNANQKRKIVELEDEIKKLSGQQNLQQRIHHHAKIKEENNTLRAQHEEISARLRRTEALLARVSDELARYRTADGRTPYISIDEEQRLRNKLQEAEEERVQLAQKLVSLCNSILQVAGVVRPPRDIDPSLAIESLQQLKERLDCAERDLQDLKLKTRIASEKMRLSELRQQSNSPLSVKANENTNSFTTVQNNCPSPAHSNPM